MEQLMSELSKLTEEQVLANRVVCASLTIAVVQLMQHGHRAIEVPAGSTFNPHLLPAVLQEAAECARAENNPTVAGLMTELAHFVMGVNEIEEAIRKEKEKN